MSPSAQRISGRALLAGGVVALVVVAVVAVLVVRDEDGTGGGATTVSSPADDADAGEPQRGGTLRVGIERPASFDPAAASPASQSELLAADLLFDGLTTMEAGESEVLAALAAEWSPSADLATWRFSLRPDAVFANGRPVTAADVKYSLERVASRGNASLAAVRLEVIVGYTEFQSGDAAGLAGVRVVDDATLEIVTTGPFAELPELLSSPVFGVVPREAVEAADVDFASAPVGSGPFAWAGLDGGGSVARLVRARDGSALVDAVELHLFADLADAYAAFVEGSVDVAFVGSDEVAEAAERFGADAFVPFGAELFYGFNLANPKFADARFRQAIVQAVDRDALVRAVYGPVAVPLAGVVPAGVPGHAADACADVCSYDPDGARALVAAAFPDGNVPEVQIDYYEGPAEEAVAGIIETSLEAVGIPAARRVKPFEEYQQFAVSGEQELFRLGWLGVYPSPGAYLSPLFTSEGADNVTGFADQGVDGLLAAAHGTLATDARLARYLEAERAIMALVPIMPLAQFKTHAVVSPQVQDLAFSVDGTFAAEVVWLDR